MSGHKREARLRQVVPGIHVFGTSGKKDVDARDKPGHDGLKGSPRVALILSAVPTSTHQSFTIARYGESWPKARLASACCVASGGVSVAYRVEFAAAGARCAAGCRRPCRLR